MCPSCPTPSPADRTTLGPSLEFHTDPKLFLTGRRGPTFHVNHKLDKTSWNKLDVGVFMEIQG